MSDNTNIDALKKLRSMREGMVDHPQFKATQKILGFYQMFKGQIISYADTGDNRREIAKNFAKYEALSEKTQDSYQERVASMNRDDINNVLSNLIPLLPDTKKGDYFLTLSDNSFTLFYLTLDQGKKILKRVDGEIDPPHFKLEDSVLRKTWFSSEDLQTCIDVCLSKKLGQTMTPAMQKQTKMDQNGHDTGSVKASKIPKNDTRTDILRPH